MISQRDEPRRVDRRAAPIAVRRVVLPVVLVLVAIVGLLPAALTASPAAADTIRAFGQNPYNDVLAAADANKKCGLNQYELAAIVLAPVFPEAGGTASLAPSPMTLSRWDTSAALWYQANKTTPYQKAFWHPGVGLWQFDSAGGWNMTAADAINTSIASQQAAKTMADRYCASSASTAAGKRSYAWGPWYGCNGVCEGIFNELYDSNAQTMRTANLNLVNTVGTKGGMVTRSCTLNGVAVTCFYVDPAAAQGNTAWAQTNFNPATPKPAPFYDISTNGREYRVWLADDTGYDTTISADKPITSDARTSLVWSTSTALCDTTASRGACGRVATTPWGSYQSAPFGSVDAATGGILQATVSGWVIDPDSNDPVTVDVEVDGTKLASVAANVSRPDVAAVVPGYGNNHGYSTTVSNLTAATHSLCVYANNIGPYGSGRTKLGCKDVTVNPIPPGPFPDVNGIHPFVEQIQWLVDQGITSGYPDGNFWPAAPMTRGGMAMFLWRAAGSPATVVGSNFSDVPADHPFAVAITWLAGQGITSGYSDGTFRPGDPITREAMAAFLYRFTGNPRGTDPSCTSAPFSDVPTSSAFCGEIDWLVDTGISTGYSDSTFRPLDTVTRQATAAFLERLLG